MRVAWRVCVAWGHLQPVLLRYNRSFESDRVGAAQACHLTSEYIISNLCQFRSGIYLPLVGTAARRRVLKIAAAAVKNTHRPTPIDASMALCTVF